MKKIILCVAALVLIVHYDLFSKVTVFVDNAKATVNHTTDTIKNVNNNYNRSLDNVNRSMDKMLEEMNQLSDWDSNTTLK